MVNSQKMENGNSQSIWQTQFRDDGHFVVYIKKFFLTFFEITQNKILMQQ